MAEPQDMDTLHIQPLVPQEAQAKVADVPAEPMAAPEPEPVATEAPADYLANPAITPAKHPVSPAAHHHRLVKKKEAHKLRPIIGAVMSFFLMLLLFKAPIVYSQIKYISNPPQASPSVLPAVTPDETVPPNPVINIPKINVSAPIVFEPSIEEANIQKALHGGVVHYGISSRPGERGNTVIVGHSSNDLWQQGNYKFVFVLLDKLAIGDTFSINYNSKKYVYEVTVAKIVEANETSVLAYTSEPTVTLITCWPAGTNLKRFVIQAKQISPQSVQVGQTESPVQNDKPSPLKLPGNSPTFSDHFQDFWKSLKEALSDKSTQVSG